MRNSTLASVFGFAALLVTSGVSDSADASALMSDQVGQTAGVSAAPGETTIGAGYEVTGVSGTVYVVGVANDNSDVTG